MRVRRRAPPGDQRLGPVREVRQHVRDVEHPPGGDALFDEVLVALGPAVATKGRRNHTLIVSPGTVYTERL